MNISLNSTVVDRKVLALARSLVISTVDGEAVGKLMKFDTARPDITLSSDESGMKLTIDVPANAEPGTQPVVHQVIDFLFI